MGYTTFFSGSVTVTPPLNEDEISFLEDFNKTRRMHRANGPLFVGGEGWHKHDNPDEVYDSNRPDPDQPGLWCQWIPSEDGAEIEWDEGEKFYDSADWMHYIVHQLLAPTARPYIDQHVKEDPRLKSFTCDHVVDGEIYAEGEESDDRWKLKVTNNVVEVVEASIAYGDEVMQIKVWTLTVDANSPIVTMVFATEQEAYESLKDGYLTADDDPDFDVTTEEGREGLIEELTERQGVVLYIDEHTLEVPA